MSLHSSPSPEEVLPLFEPRSLLQLSIADYWPTYILLIVFVVLAIRRRSYTTVERCPADPPSRWLAPVFFVWGIQAVTVVIGGFWDGLLSLKLDMFVALTTLILVLIAVVVVVAIRHFRQEVPGQRPVPALLLPLVVVTTVALDYAFVCLLMTKIE